MADRFSRNGHPSWPTPPESGAETNIVEGPGMPNDRYLDRALRALYRDILSEPVPQRLIDVIAHKTRGNSC